MLTLPMAPSDGLFLDKAFFEQYNERATQIGLAASLDWEDDTTQGEGGRERGREGKNHCVSMKLIKGGKEGGGREVGKDILLYVF